MKKAIGIDLGTTNSVMAYKDTAVRIIRNKEQGELTRSCVTFQKGELIKGNIAYDLLKRDPENTILSIKRLMGGAIKDAMVQEMLKSDYYKFKITALKEGTDDAVAVILGGKQYVPEQISSEILKKLKEDAEEKLGDEITHAVITVPAYFTEKQKNATRIAAQLAGLKVQKLLAEPTAAAIAYGVDNLKIGDTKTVLIFDFGGGTFDLSILNIVDGQYLEAGTGGDRWLGGDDIDRKLQELVLKKVSENYDIKNISNLINNLSPKNRFLFEGEIRFKTEAVKIQLSSAKSASIIIDNILEDENGEVIDVDIVITKDEFEKIVNPYVDRCIDLIDDLLKEVGYDINMIDSILLVGGSSCIPLVKQKLSEKYGAQKIKMTEKPMLVVAEGAAILSHKLADSFECSKCGKEIKPNQKSCTSCGEDVEKISKSNIEDISWSTNHNYYIELLEGDHDKIIEKLRPLPITVSRIYKTTVNNQKIVKVSIFTDIEDGKIKDSPETTGFFAIDEDLPINSEFVFNFTLDINEILEMQVHPKANKTKVKKVVLGRGNKDSKALGFISDCFDKILSENYSERQREYFINTAKKEIDKIDSIGTENRDSKKWDEIGTNTFTAFEQAEKRIQDDVDEDTLVITFGIIILNEYRDLIDEPDATKMQQLVVTAQNDTDPLNKIQSIQELKILTDKYGLLITIFEFKIISDIAAKSNSADSKRLLILHDEIINNFRNQNLSEVDALLREAITLREKYAKGTIDLGSIRIKK